MSAPDVVVAWLQNDYGQLGRPAESIAHALVDDGLARRVAYVEPFIPSTQGPALQRQPVRGLDVYSATGAPPAGREFARAVIASSQLEDPVLLNFGVGDANWWFHHEFAPLVSRTVLVTHDKLVVAGMDEETLRIRGRVRDQLVRGSDAIVGLSEGSIDDVPGATYVGHGTDAIWQRPGMDALSEPPDLAAIPHPRALYFGTLSLRIEHEAIGELARSGVHVVLIGIAPSPAVQALIDAEPNVHYLGPRSPEASAAYLLHCDVGIVPHTDEPFTRSMEPHKLYNYACAGLPAVTLHCALPPALEPDVRATESRDDFVAATLDAIAAGRLDRSRTDLARTRSWGSVARALMDAALPQKHLITAD